MSDSIDERITDEVEALEAILMDDVVIKRMDDMPILIETVVHPSTGDDAEQQYVCVTLEVKLTDGYPDTSPHVLLRNPRGLDDAIIATIESQITDKLNECLGQPVVFELIELIRENLTNSNLPSGQCAICLYGFTEGDIFIKTQCYHYFHNHCLASHLIALERNYREEKEKLPAWQQALAPAYQQTCPVCRSEVSCDVESLKLAPPPLASVTAAPFCLTAELKALQSQMAALLARQRARGGLVCSGEPGPPPLTITGPNDAIIESRSSSASVQNVPKVETKVSPVSNGTVNGHASRDDGHTSPTNNRERRGHYRGGHHRRGKGKRSTR